MSRFTLWQAIYLSFYSKEFYRDVVLNWRGKSFLYLFILLALTWIYPTYRMQTYLHAAYRDFAHQVVPQMPILEIKDGKIKTPLAKPYIITYPKNQQRFLVIDTTGTFTTLEQAQTEFLLTQTSLITKNRNETKIYQVPQKTTLTLVPQQVNGVIEGLIGYSWVVLFFACLFVSYCYRIIQACLYAVIGVFYNSIYQANLTYGKMILLSMVAITPTILIASIFDVLQISFSFQYILYLVLGVGYLGYAISANKNR